MHKWGKSHKNILLLHSASIFFCYKMAPSDFSQFICAHFTETHSFARVSLSFFKTNHKPKRDIANGRSIKNKPVLEGIDEKISLGSENS